MKELFRYPMCAIAGCNIGKAFIIFLQFFAVVLIVLYTASVQAGDYAPPYPVTMHIIPAEKLTFHTPYYVVDANGRRTNTEKAHLISEHGYTAADLQGLTYDQLNRIHGWEHTHSKSLRTYSAFPSTPPSLPQYEYQIQCNGKHCKKVRVRIN